MSIKHFAGLAVLGLSLAAGSALASGGGGGGGGGMPSNSAPAYDPVEEYAKGKEALSAGKFKDADRALGHVLEVAPKDADTLFMMGLAKTGENDLKGAKRYFEKTLKIDPNHTNAQVELVLFDLKLGDRDGAKSQYDALIARATACADTCPEAAVLKAAIKTADDAMNAKPAMSAPAEVPGAPSPPPTGTPIGALAPNTASLLFADNGAGDHAYVQAVSLINEGRYDDALAALHRAQAVFGPHPDVLTYIGFTYRKLGRLDLAEPYYQQALAIAPNHLGATEYYGELKVEKGDLVGARQMLAKLQTLCTFGCAEEDSLRRWIDAGKEP